MPIHVAPKELLNITVLELHGTNAVLRLTPNFLHREFRAAHEIPQTETDGLRVNGAALATVPISTCWHGPRASPRRIAARWSGGEVANVYRSAFSFVRGVAARPPASAASPEAC
jgi:hypothetical protein